MGRSGGAGKQRYLAAHAAMYRRDELRQCREATPTAPAPVNPVVSDGLVSDGPLHPFDMRCHT